ncbi:MAG: hypothetical protein Q8O40_15670, partial [Chloroflexota bacterium]|nr:hypothetical protein [Chloroflexota bacterium]
SLALIGYRYAGEADEVVVALYYPDPAGAERDAKELERRWNTLYYDPIGSHEAEIPVTNSCAPFTTKVVAQRDGSVLIGSCRAAMGQHTGGGGKGAGLWNWLFTTGELQFMAPDIEALKAAAGQT